MKKHRMYMNGYRDGINKNLRITRVAWFVAGFVSAIIMVLAERL